MTRQCTGIFSGYHKTTLKKVMFKPDDTSTLPQQACLILDILTTSSRDGSIYIWDLRCTGLQNATGTRYKPVGSILGGHPISRTRKSDVTQGCAITGLTWHKNTIISACDANSYRFQGEQRLIDLGWLKSGIRED